MPALLAEMHKCQTLQALAEQQFMIPEMSTEEAKETEDGKSAPPTSFRTINGVTKDQLESLYVFAHMLYDQGAYGECADLLVVYNQQLKIVEKDPEASSMVSLERQLNVKWGLLACYILGSKWEQAAFAALVLDATLDDKITKKTELMKQRTVLAHWLLFIIFKAPSEKVEHAQIAKCIEMFISEKYLTLMSFRAPYLFRYAAACFMVYRHEKSFKDDLMHVLAKEYIKQDDGTVLTSIGEPAEKDLLIEFLLALFTKTDYDLASSLLAQFGSADDENTHLYRNDYFLHDKGDQFVLNSRILVFENYCKMHQSVEVSTVASKMAMSVAEAEAWIVEKMRTGRLGNANISFEGERAFVSFERRLNTERTYSQIVDKTKNMAYRLYMLQVNAGVVVNPKKKDAGNLTSISPDIAVKLAGVQN